MYTALERERAYRIAGEVMIYDGRVFEDDHPPTFVFRKENGELVGFFLEQLTAMEQDGQLKYIGVSL